MSINTPELDVILQFDLLELQLTIAIFLSGLSKTQLTEEIIGKYDEEFHKNITQKFAVIQNKVVDTIQEYWDDDEYCELYEDLHDTLIEKTFYKELAGEISEDERDSAEHELEVFCRLSRSELQLIIAALLSGFSKKKMAQDIFKGNYKIEYHVRVADMLSFIQKRIAGFIERTWDDCQYEEMYCDLKKCSKNLDHTLGSKNASK